jgi:hypothetical protein
VSRAIARLRAVLRVWIEDRLPWYDRVRESERDAETERIRRDSIRTRVLAERRLAGYRSVRLRR